MGEKSKPTPSPVRGMSGPRTIYRPKQKVPFTIMLTATGRGIVERDCAKGSPKRGTFSAGRTRLRPGDYTEYLYRTYGHLVPDNAVEILAEQQLAEQRKRKKK